MASCAFNKRIHTPFGETKMNANDIAFGIELETTMPATDTTPIGGYHNGLPVAWLPAGWKAERDSSIHDARREPQRMRICIAGPSRVRRTAKRLDRGRRDHGPRRPGQLFNRNSRNGQLRKRRRGPFATDLADRQPRTGHLRFDRNATPRTKPLGEADQGLRQQRRRETPMRIGPLPSCST